MMKRLVKLMFLLVFSSLLFACNESLQVSDDVPGLELKKAVLDCPVFMVYPNGTDDTGNLLQAFDDAKNAGPGSVVQLVEGEYFLNFVEIREFTGSFVGAGKGKTVITALTGLDCNALTTLKLYSYLIKFVGGDMLVGHMTIRAPSSFICGSGGVSGLLMFSDYTAQYNSINGHIRAMVDNVELLGMMIGTKYNASKGINAFPDTRATTGLTRSHIDLSVTNCVFDNLQYGIQYQNINGGEFVLGRKNNGNVFTSCYQPASCYDVINVDISAIGNTFIIPKGVYYGLDVINSPSSKFIFEPQTRKTLLKIEFNEFSLLGGDCGLYLHDHRRVTNPSENLPIVCEISHNKVLMTDEAYIAFSMIDLHSAVIRNNNFSGNGLYGCASGGCASGGYTENSLYLGNNFSNATFSVTSIFLNPRSRNCTIIGGSVGDNITDLGVNNRITGMNINNSDTPPGQSIVDNLHWIKEEMTNKDDE